MQSHMLTLDKIVCEMPMAETFNMNQTPETNAEHITQYGPNQGVFISNFDNFMPKNNPIVNFVEEYDPPK